MDTNQHARIFYAYLARLTPASLDDIYRTQKEAEKASLNSGLSLQIQRQTEAMQAVQAGVARMIDHDKNNIQRIIETAL